MKNASVKVMRSYDYCHFEVSLSSDEDMTLDEVDAMRQEAAVLVDEAVRQYKLAKKAEEARSRRDWEMRALLDRIDHIKTVPQSDWSVEQAALMRAYEDKTFWKEFEETDYYYSDPEREHHFSMLRRFKEARVLA